MKTGLATTFSPLLVEDVKRPKVDFNIAPRVSGVKNPNFRGEN
jgi:hypothetical protein